MDIKKGNKILSVTRRIQQILRELRIEKGMTQQEVAEKLNRSPQYVAQIEQAEKPSLTYRKLLNFAKVYEVPPNDLIKHLGYLNKGYSLVYSDGNSKFIPQRQYRRNDVLSGVKIFSLLRSQATKENLNARFEVVLTEWESGDTSLKHAHFGEEFFWLLEGKLEFSFLKSNNDNKSLDSTSWSEKTIISSHDDEFNQFLWLNSTRPHQIKCIGNRKAKALMVFYSPRSESITFNAPTQNSKDLIVQEQSEEEKINLDNLSYGLGFKIKKARLNAGKTLSEMAEEIGISKSELSKLENHQTDPKIELIQWIAESTDVGIEYFFPDPLPYFSSIIDESNARQARKNSKQLFLPLLKDEDCDSALRIGLLYPNIPLRKKLRTSKDEKREFVTFHDLYISFGVFYHVLSGSLQINIAPPRQRGEAFKPNYYDAGPPIRLNEGDSIYIKEGKRYFVTLTHGKVLRIEKRWV